MFPFVFGIDDDGPMSEQASLALWWSCPGRAAFSVSEFDEGNAGVANGGMIDTR